MRLYLQFSCICQQAIVERTRPGSIWWQDEWWWWSTAKTNHINVRALHFASCSPILSWPMIMFSKRVGMTVAINAVKYVECFESYGWQIEYFESFGWQIECFESKVECFMSSSWCFSIFYLFSVFSMFSQLTPYSPIRMAGWNNL